MKVTKLKTGGFLSSGSDAGDLEILRKIKLILNQKNQTQYLMIKY